MSDLNLKVQPISLSQRVYQALVVAILDGHFKPGDWLRESFLCEELGVSSTPLREALQRLVHEGLAERIPNVGVRVAVLDTEDVIEIYDLREYLERLAIRL
ncbi:GntR family transcriptional regulator, partial [Candidatus Bathyarchaeota archaeon]|nr:GntR family transcriptional regulator [Candidatus Bathyarchaeota archaeon]